jgi:hypothetical protein
MPIATEITLGPLRFVWEPNELWIIVLRGGITVAKIEHVYEDTWRNFVEAARPYQGPG